MANLSNINNKFLVTTGGNVLIGGTAVVGTAKLQVTGEARVYTGSNLGYWGVDAGNSYVYLGTNSSAYGLSLQTGGIDRVNINDAGNVFISTPITNAFYGLSLTYNNTNTADFTVNQATGQIKIGGVATGYFPTFYSAGTERMRIDNSGNLLLGNGVGNPYLAFLSAGGNGGNERARMYGYADGGTYGGGLKLQTRDNSNIFNDALVIDRSGNAVIKGKIESVKELVNINSANGIRSAGLESDSTGNIWLGTGTTAATINFVTGNSTNSIPSVNGVKRLTTNREGTDVYASYAGNTFPFRVGYLVGSTYTPTFVVDDNSNVGIGTDSPDNILHIRKGDTTYASQVGADTMLFLETTNVSNALQFTSTNTGQQYIMFGDDDPNAGWISYNHSDNNLNFRVNATERMRIDSSGKMTIPAAADGIKFEITSSAGSGHSIIEMGQVGSDGFLDVSAAGGNIVTHLSGYNGYTSYFASPVGIGTTEGTGGFNVNNSTAGSYYNMSNPDSGNYKYTNAGGRLLTSNATGWFADGRDPILTLSTSGNSNNSAIGNSIGLNLYTNSATYGVWSPLITFSALSDSGNYGNAYAAIAGRKVGLGPDSNWNTGDLCFWTSGPIASNPASYMQQTPSMIIQTGGNVGIGTGSPDALLELSKDASGTQGATLRLTNSVGGSGAGVAIEFNGPGGQPIHAKIKTEDLGAYDSKLIFQTKVSGTSGALSTRMSIDNNGQVYISGGCRVGGLYITALQGNAQLTNASTSSGSNASYIGQGLISVSISDAKAKENFSDVQTNECLNKIVSLADHVKKFDWIDEDWNKEKGRTVGMVAQEIYEDHSEFVHKPENYDDDGWAIRYQEIVPTLIKAIQELKAEIELLKSK